MLRHNLLNELACVLDGLIQPIMVTEDLFGRRLGLRERHLRQHLQALEVRILHRLLKLLITNLLAFAGACSLGCLLLRTPCSHINKVFGEIKGDDGINTYLDCRLWQLDCPALDFWLLVMKCVKVKSFSNF